MLQDTETHPYIDLLDLQFPYKYSDLLTEEDSDIIKGHSQVSEITQTENFVWYPNPYDSYAPIGGSLHRNSIARILFEFLNDTFSENIVGESLKNSLGKTMFPISILKFHHSTKWHREGFPYWADEQIKSSYRRNNFAINFPLYCETADTKVRFAKATNELEHNVRDNMQLLMEQDKWTQPRNINLKNMFENYIENMGKSVYANNIETTFAMDLLDDELEEHLTVVGEKVSYDCPYIIPLSSWHRVITNGQDNRCSLRFFGNNDYTFSDICRLYDEGDLFKG